MLTSRQSIISAAVKHHSGEILSITEGGFSISNETPFQYI